MNTIPTNDRFDCYRIYLLLAILLLMDLLAAFTMEIHPDEAYYRLYGQYLAWGYFDHPPMVALLTHLSDLIWGGFQDIGWRNLSVRFCTTWVHMLTSLVLWYTIREEIRVSHRNMLFFWMLLMSMVMYVAYGFITTPDVPLLFFAALFYYLLRRYLDRPDWLTAIGLGITMAGMMYSKYMAVLVILFAVLGCPRLIRDGRLWVALLLALGLMVPHFWWQYANDFPSLRYHLVDRSASHYSILYTLEYIPNQLVVFNPLAYGLMLFFSVQVWRTGDTDPMHRIAAMTIVGFQIFFLLMMFRGHVEPHWTVVTTLPAILLLTENVDYLQQRKGLWVGLILMFMLVGSARLLITGNVTPERWGLCGNRARMAEIHEEHGDEVVVFTGSFQDVSLYRFYYDDRAVHRRNPGDRYTQYDLLNLCEGE